MIKIAPKMISQAAPTMKPDFAKTYGRPRIPAPIIVPDRVNAAERNFLFMISPCLLRIMLFL